MSLLKHILFLLLIVALAVTPGTVSHEVEASDSPAIATCATDFGDLLSQLGQASANVNSDQISKAFCGHFTVDLDHTADASSNEMVHSTPLFFAQSNPLANADLLAETLILPVEQQLHSLHPEVAPHPPKA
ncbi:hypothetical protein ACFO5Q_16935 [Kordiimonas lipolytica]|uniref:DUF2946 domain-containing protein n=1 Tax=Kordiimonas lipolytica TaxID=1662421 RepID=A0ABV8UFZ5_9PROT|nr:hypothetical protein [Kordiimonas lipolytica]